MALNPYAPPEAGPESPAAATVEGRLVRRGVFVAVLADTVASVGWRFISAVGILLGRLQPGGGFDPHIPTLVIKLAGSGFLLWAAAP